MIIRRMRATFGKLDDQEIRLQPGMNIISGANETGKSTWIAFLLAMLYGVDTKERVRGTHMPDKIKYLPWSGKPMSGAMDLEADGRDLSIERTSETAPMGDFRAWDRVTGTPLTDLTGKTCGQTLLGVEASVYARSGFLRQQHIAVSADAQLEKRLSSLVTSGSEDYSFAEIDEKLKKLQTFIRHNQSGALPRAEGERNQIELRLKAIEENQRHLTELEAELNDLRKQREEKRNALAGLDTLDQWKRQEIVDAAQAAMEEAKEDRESWEAVCADLPDESVLQGLEAELQQLQNDLQRVALESGKNISELERSGFDPVFKRMSAREAHDKAAADATVVKNAKAAKRPYPNRSPYWLILMVVGLGVGFVGAFLPLLPLVIGGIAAAVAGMLWWIWLRFDYNRRKDEYILLQRQAQSILKAYGAKNARGIVLRGIQYINSLDELEEYSEGSVFRNEIELLSDRQAEILARIEEVMPGCGTPEKAAALFQEASKSRQELARAAMIEQQRSVQLRELRENLGASAANMDNAERYAAYDRDVVTQEIKELEEQIEITASRADKLAGAISQMGDCLALSAEAEELVDQISRMEERYAALHLARHALMEADETLRSKFAPLLCEKTGALFSRLTDGRYDGVRLDRSLHVTVHPKDSSVYRPLSYLSGGTVDQLYLALRLSICELLLPKAPIVLDDALVYFDDKRIALALETLKEMSKTRQIILFACQSREKRILDELSAGKPADEEERPLTVS